MGFFLRMLAATTHAPALTAMRRSLQSRTPVEGALWKSYNRWMADVWSQGKNRLRWAAVLPAFAHAKNSRLVALVSSDAEKRARLGRRYRCDAFDLRDLDDVLDLADVDAVYIAEPNDTWTSRCAARRRACTCSARSRWR